ncbi:MAG: hypothetical protein ACYDGU_10795 [Acidiferrobacterales bacterium]
MASSILLMSPSYSFMYLQGMTGAGVLLTAILAAASFSNLRRVFNRELGDEASKRRRYFSAFLWFFLGCLMYPVWEFLVVTLALLEFGFDVDRPMGARLKRLSAYLSFYALSAALYYSFVKLSIRGCLALAGVHESLRGIGEYRVALQLSPQIVWRRTIEAAKYFYAMPLSNLKTPPGLPVILLVLFSLSVGFEYRSRKNRGFVMSIGTAAAVLAVSSIVLLGSISPWLFSRFVGMPAYMLLPWYLFFSAVPAGILTRFWRGRARWMDGRFLAAIFVLAVVPIATTQNKASFLQVAVSDYEIWSMGHRLDKWLDARKHLTRGSAKERYLLVVLPRDSRPAFVNDALIGQVSLAGNAVLASSQNPVSIPWMINALLRRRPEVASSIHITDCGFSQRCAEAALAHSKNVVLGMTYGRKPIRAAELPFIINLSSLTSDAVRPTIKMDRDVGAEISGRSR